MLFPSSDKLTTSTIIDARDLSELQRERLTSSLSIQGMDVTTYTFKRVKVAFDQLFCTPRSSMDNPSLRTSRIKDPLSRYCSFNRTFKVQDGSKENFEQWAADELSREQGYVDVKKNSCFWSCDDNHSTWKSRQFKSRQFKKRQQKFKGDAHPRTGSSTTENFAEEEHDPPWETGDWYFNCSDDLSSAWCNSRYTALMASVLLDLAHHRTHVVLHLWLHTINWVKKGNPKVPEICVVSWHHNRRLSSAIGL